MITTLKPYRVGGKIEWKCWLVSCKMITTYISRWFDQLNCGNAGLLAAKWELQTKKEMKCLNQWKCWLVSCKMITTMLAFFVLLFSSWKCWLVSCKMITTSYCYCTGNIYWWKCWLVSCKMITTERGDNCSMLYNCGNAGLLAAKW